MRSCAAGKSKYYTFYHFDHSFEELKYNTGIVNLKGQELVAAAYDDPPRVYMKINKTVNRFSAESGIDRKSKQI